MISIASTETKIEELIRELLVTPLAQPAFDLTTHPGNLDDANVGARRTSNVLVRFKSIDFDDNSTKNPAARCVTQVNWINFTILVNNNNLRTHRDVYAIAQAIMTKLRGKQVAVAEGGEHIVGSKVIITSFSFDSFDKTKSCNKAEITLKFSYTDVYETM